VYPRAAPPHGWPGRSLADGTVSPVAPRWLAIGHESQRQVEIVVCELPREVRATFTDGSVDLPDVLVVQLPELLLVAHQTCLLTRVEPRRGQGAVR
jgi:hypothetical protein